MANTTRMIDADALIESIEQHACSHCVQPEMICSACPWSTLISSIHAAATVELEFENEDEDDEVDATEK